MIKYGHPPRGDAGFICPAFDFLDFFYLFGGYMKKLLLIISFILIAIGGYFGYSKYQKYKEEQRIKNAIIKVELKDNLEVVYNSKVYVSDFIKSINGNIVNNYLIDTKEVGEKNVAFSFVNDEGIKVNYTYKIKIIDNTAPTISLGNSYTINKGYNKNLLDVILCYDDYDDNPECTITGEYDVNTLGSYPLTFMAWDHYGNETRRDFTLKVIEKTNKPSSTSKSIPFKELYQEYKSNDTLIGIDVSKWQGDIDFQKVKDSGVEFVFIKMGGENGLDKEYYLDPKFERNIEGFKKVGIPVGIYYYSHANTTEKAFKDALWVHENINKYQIDLPIVLDWENWGSYNKYHMSINTLNNVANTFLKSLKLLGHDVLLYSSKNYLEKFWINNNHDVWLAHYTKNTTYQGKYAYWQRTSLAKIPGISGNTVDFDIYYK